MSVAGPKAPSLLPTSKCRTVYRGMKPRPTVLLVGRYFAGEILGFHIKKFWCPNPPNRGTKTTRREESEKMSSIAIARQHRARSLRKLADCGSVRTA